MFQIIAHHVELPNYGEFNLGRAASSCESGCPAVVKDRNEVSMV
jgi:hypothetical protein